MFVNIKVSWSLRVCEDSSQIYWGSLLMDFVTYLLIIIYVQGITFELDDTMVADDEDREMLQEIINNSKLSEGYLTLARDIEVMEPKSPEDIYKVWFWW